jgi:DNA-binding winged helix-turn-helix (wHTH) protein
MRLTAEDWVFDSDTREVVRKGRAVPLSPKAFDLLELLIRRRPKAVSKDEIRERLWPDTFVSPANLANLVVELRAALNDDARAPRVVRTVPRFGYAFAADADASPERPRRGRSPLACRLVWGPREIALDPGENLVGRDRESVVWIDDASVSRKHARIAVDDAGATVEDLGSKNGTFVRGRRIEKAARLADGDPIRIGPASLIFRAFRTTGSTASTVSTVSTAAKALERERP